MDGDLIRVSKNKKIDRVNVSIEIITDNNFEQIISQQSPFEHQISKEDQEDLSPSENHDDWTEEKNISP